LPSLDKSERRKRSAQWARDHYAPRSALSVNERSAIRAKAKHERDRQWAALTPEEQARRATAARDRRQRWVAAHPERAAASRRKYLDEHAAELAACARARAKVRYWADPEASRARQRERWSEKDRAAQSARQRADPRISFCTQANRKARLLGTEDRIFPRDIPPGPWICSYCAEPSRSFDHVLPFSRGGQNIPTNIVPCCRSCNASKKNRLVSEWPGRHVRLLRW